MLTSSASTAAGAAAPIANKFRTWVTRWNDLRRDRAKNDFLFAQLAHEIRAEFPRAESGDIQFKEWVKANLPHAFPQGLLEKARAFAIYADPADWMKHGGWSGITFLMGLTKAERNKVSAEIKTPTVSHTTLRKRALKLGIVTRRKLGRDTRTKSEVKIQLLRVFIQGLYKNPKVSGLPPIPKNIQDALRPAILSAIPAWAKQAA